VGGRGRRGALGGALVLALVVACRRRRAQAALALAAALAQTGCQTSVFGSGPGDIESGCPGAGEVSRAIGVLWSPQAGPCTATLVASDVVVTAAHCVAGAAAAGDPISMVLGSEQYIADHAEVHPDWAPGAPADDVAVVVMSRPVEGIDPLALVPAEPLLGAAFKLVGHGEWSPDDPRDAERQAQVGAVSDVQARSFSYEEEVDDACLRGRGGGPVLAGDAPEQMLGLHGEGRRVMRLDRYACWLACGAGSALPSGLAGCDCTRADVRPCNDCGAEFLDFTTRVWSACAPAEELHPCADGLTCDAGGYCVP
jgi:hypothetical protein